MKVRIRLDPGKYPRWVVESKKWYQFEWRGHEAYMGDDAMKIALEHARQLANPQVEYVK